MFKRLFILSGVIAFFLSCAMMWFWYLPMKEQEKNTKELETIENSTDSISVAATDSIGQ